LPPEICSTICDEVEESRSLARLCRTSRLFRDRAQPILYHSVDLSTSGRSMRAVKSWTTTVTRHPHLAERVHTLALRLPATVAFEAKDATKLKQALDCCVNLKELRALGDGGRWPDGSHGWMINGCPFRLTAFENQYFRDLWIQKFWEEQTEIRMLSIPHSPYPICPDILPNVIALETTYLVDLPEDRALQRFQTDFHRDFSPLKQYAQTLTTLNIRRKWTDQKCSLSDSLIAIAVSLPALVHLGIIELVKQVLSIEPTPTPTLQRFFKLETLILQVRNVSHFKNQDPVNAFSYNMAAAEDLEALGSAIMTACSTLRRAAIGAEAQSGTELTCVLTKSRRGKIHAEAGTAFDFEVLSMFWEP
ncbi:hypothetical protein B0H19DRAFT_1147261, partial [Mycena capillaripes]